VDAASRVIALGAGLAWIGLELGARHFETEVDPGEEKWLRRALMLAAGFAALVAIPPLLDPWILARSDAWVHGSLVWELLDRGFPPEDPRFAGLTLNYVWFYNWFIALLSSVHRQDPFRFMGIFNVVHAFVFVGLVFALARSVWGRGGPALGAALLVVTGLEAGAWILWPLRGLRGVFGDVTGLAATLAEYRLPPLGSWRVMYDLAAPFAEMVNVPDKFMIGTALGAAWILLLVLLYTSIRWLSGGPRGWLVLAGISSLGQLLFHGVVGLSAIPVTLATLAALFLAGRLGFATPPGRRIFALAAAIAVGAGLGLPYTRAIASGWSSGASGLAHSYLALQPRAIWTILTSCAVVIALAVGPLRSLSRVRPPALMMAIWTVGMLLFAALIDLPANNESKFVFQAFFGLVLFAGGAV
jgi:hypothetical protein